MREPLITDLDRQRLEGAVDNGIRRYFADRRNRIEPFIDRHFTLVGAARLHRKAVGLDIVRAPANVALVVPTVGLKVTALAAGAVGAADAAEWLRRRNLFVETDVGRELAWLIHTELLELPYLDGKRSFEHDAMAATILAEPEIAAALAEAAEIIERHAEEREFAERLRRTLATYAGARVAGGDIATAALGAALGAISFKQVTTGALSLGPAIAGAVAHQAAVASFPLGAWAGGVWYSAFPTAPTAMATVGATAGVMALAAVVAAFAGVIADPLLRQTGLHRRRLGRMLDSLEAQFLGRDRRSFTVRDHYVGRLIDLFEIVRAVHRAI